MAGRRRKTQLPARWPSEHDGNRGTAATRPRPARAAARRPPAPRRGRRGRASGTPPRRCRARPPAARPRPPSQSASGGPFVVVDVVRTPAENPATPAVVRPGACCSLGRAPQEAVRDEHAHDHADRDPQRRRRAARARAPPRSAAPGARPASRAGVPPVDGQRAPLGAEHQHVDAEPEDQQQRDGVAGRHDGVQRRPGEQREAEARRRLERYCEQQRDDGEGDYLSTCMAPPSGPSTRSRCRSGM